MLNLLLFLLTANPYIGTVTSAGSTARLELPAFEKVMVQCDADAYYLMGSSAVEVTSSTGARLTGNASPWPEKTEGSGLRYIAVISVSGTANCKVWKDTRDLAARAAGAQGGTRLLSYGFNFTPGNCTINAESGCCALGIATTSINVTNSFVRETAIIHITGAQDPVDTTCFSFGYVSPVSAGGFTINANAPCTDNTAVCWTVHNTQ